MKKLIFTTLIFCLAFVSAPAMAATVTDDYFSDGNVIVEAVYNHDESNTDPVSATTMPPNTYAVHVYEPTPYPTACIADADIDRTSDWDTSLTGYIFPLDADWIWDSYLANNGETDGSYYDPAKWGHAVLFSVDFSVPGTPVSATIHITADNCYACWINSETGRVDGATAYGTSGWETGLMTQDEVMTYGWEPVGTHSLSGLVSGNNTLYVLAGNERYTSPDTKGTPPNVVPQDQGDQPYYLYNPGGVIFHLEVEYEELVPNVSIKKYVSVDGGPWEDADSAPGPSAMVGDPIEWKYVVTNTGQVPLTNVIVTDDQSVTPGYDGGDTNTNGELDLTETWIYYASGTATVAGLYTNIGTVDTDEEVTDSDPANYTAEEEEAALRASGRTMAIRKARPPGIVMFRVTTSATFLAFPNKY